MNSAFCARKLMLVVLALASIFMAGHVFAEDTIKGQVLGGGVQNFFRLICSLAL